MVKLKQIWSKHVAIILETVLLVATLATLTRGINVSISMWNLPIIPDIWSDEWNLADHVLKFSKALNLTVKVVLLQITTEQMEITINKILTVVDHLSHDYGSYIDYWQVFGEIDAMKKPNGSLYMTTELENLINVIANEIRINDKDACIVMTSFTNGFFIWRSELARINLSFLDYIGIDIYESSQILVAPKLVLYRSVFNKPLVICEFGSCDPDPNVKADYIKSWADFYEKNGITMAIAFDWNLGLYSLNNTNLTF